MRILAISLADSLDDIVEAFYMVLSESQEVPRMNVQTGEPIIAPSSSDHPLYDAVVEACRTVHDPEIPVNIYDLGLVYVITIDSESHVEISMTLTAPGCPVAGEMPGWVADAVGAVPGVRTVNVELVWEPPWGMEMLSDEARLELGFM
jgi:FeS assembly SUF system protein